LSLALIVISGPLAAFAVGTAVAVASLVGIAIQATAVILILQDLWTMLHGGKSAFGEAGKFLDYYLVKLLKLIGAYDRLKAVVQVISDLTTTGGNNVSNRFDLKNLDEVSKQFKERFQSGGNVAGGLASSALAPSVSSNRSNSVHQENHVEVNVNGDAGSGHATGRVIGDSLKKTLSDAAYQIPLPAY
jgi:hypothetical protein